MAHKELKFNEDARRAHERVHGCAYVPALVPAGVTADEIK